jgi:hypothetical protein
LRPASLTAAGSLSARRAWTATAKLREEKEQADFVSQITPYAAN